MKEFFRVLYTFIYYFIQCVYKHCTHIFTSIYQKLLLVFHRHNFDTVYIFTLKKKTFPLGDRLNVPIMSNISGFLSLWGLKKNDHKIHCDGGAMSA